MPVGVVDGDLNSTVRVRDRPSASNARRCDPPVSAVGAVSPSPRERASEEGDPSGIVNTRDDRSADAVTAPSLRPLSVGSPARLGAVRFSAARPFRGIPELDEGPVHCPVRRTGQPRPASDRPRGRRSVPPAASADRVFKNEISLPAAGAFPSTAWMSEGRTTGWGMVFRKRTLGTDGVIPLARSDFMYRYSLCNNGILYGGWKLSAPGTALPATQNLRPVTR